MNRHEKALVLLLRLDGSVMLVAVLAAMMPAAWMEQTHRWLGMGDLPAGPIVDYLTRSLSLMYAMHGGLLLIISTNVRRYLPVVKFVAVATMLFAAGITALDITVGMPPFWTASEGPGLLLLYGAVLWLSRHVPKSL